MKSRWFSTFTLIGILLLALGIGGLVLQHSGTRFVFDPGQPPSGGEDRTPWYYLVIGALMVLNGLITPALTPEEAAEKRAKVRRDVSASPARTRTPSAREAIVTSADKTGE